MGVIREERPGIDGEGAGFRQRGHPGYELVSVGVVPEDDAPLEPSHHTKSGRHRGGLVRGVRLKQLLDDFYYTQFSNLIFGILENSDVLFVTIIKSLVIA